MIDDSTDRKEMEASSRLSDRAREKTSGDLDLADHLGNSRYELDTVCNHPHTGRYRFPRVA